MNIFHYILLALTILLGFSAIRDYSKSKDKVSTIVGFIVIFIWCALIILSAYY